MTFSHNSLEKSTVIVLSSVCLAFPSFAKVINKYLISLAFGVSLIGFGSNSSLGFTFPSGSKKDGFLDSDGNVKPSDELETKPIKLTPKAKEIKYLLMTLANEGNAKQTDDNTMTVDFPKELWEKVIDFVERLN